MEIYCINVSHDSEFINNVIQIQSLKVNHKKLFFLKSKLTWNLDCIIIQTRYYKVGFISVFNQGKNIIWIWLLKYFKDQWLTFNCVHICKELIILRIMNGITSKNNTVICNATRMPEDAAWSAHHCPQTNKTMAFSITLCDSRVWQRVPV